MYPDPRGIGDPNNGIAQVVRAYGRYLPELGVEFVGEREPCDLTVIHAGSGPESADVAMLHGLYFSADGDSERWEWAANANVITTIRSAYAVTVPSPWVAETIQRDFHFNPTVIGHGIEADEWEPGENKGYVLWNKNRGTDACSPEALNWLAAQKPGTQFISTFGIPGPNVKLVGQTSSGVMKKLVCEAGAYLATAKETFGIGTLEALAAGVPVVGWRWGGTADIVRHEETGYLATPGDYEDLAAGLTYCLTQRARLSAAARQDVRRFAWPAICQQVLAVWQAALVEKQRPASVAVVIPCFNYGDVVGRAITSALAQTRPPEQIIVVDDGSTDKTAEVVSALAATNPSVTYLPKVRGGVATARNAGIAAATTKYVCTLDADDQIAPEFLATCLPALEADNALGVAYTGLTEVLPDGRQRQSVWPGACDPDQQLHGHNQVPTCSVFRRRVWERLGGFRQRYAPQGAGSEDAEFWLRALAYGFAARKVSDAGLFLYSVGTGMVSSGKWQGAPWLGWHPWTRDYLPPCGALFTPTKNRPSHPVRQYDRPIVSVVIPVGPGHQQTLVDALDSLEAQTFRRWEAVVVNDTGGPLDLSAYPYVRVLLTAGKIGAGAARNQGMQSVRAPLVVFLDADDYLQADFLTETLLARHETGADWVYTDCEILHDDGKREDFPAEDWNVRKLCHSGLTGITCLHTTASWQKVGGFDPESGREDWEFHLRLAAAGICGTRVPKTLWTYRHATGARRDAPGLKEEAQRLYQKYPVEAIEMACSTCGGKKRTPAVPKERVPLRQPMTEQARRAPVVSAGDQVEIEYTGMNRADVVYRGSAGGTYAFGDNEANRRKWVRASDVPNLLRLAVFRVAEPVVVPTDVPGASTSADAPVDSPRLAALPSA